MHFSKLVIENFRVFGSRERRKAPRSQRPSGAYVAKRGKRFWEDLIKPSSASREREDAGDVLPKLDSLALEFIDQRGSAVHNRKHVFKLMTLQIIAFATV